MTRVRFAPSPTGYLHIGGVRTALFNFLYAQAREGKFFVRIEDTDRERSKPEFETEILESLEWLGLKWEGEITRQSSRLERYRELAAGLLASGHAYEDIEEGKKAVKFRMPKIRAKFADLVHGEVEFDTSLFDDLVLIKSDGYPTYHWACVVDDHEMEISHVIRGDDHLSNTPRQILLFQAMGWKAPQYGHLPLIAGEDGSPLSKRHGAVALSHFRKEGYLPEAILNYLALLGWNPGTPQEFFQLSELIKKFSLKQINKSNAKFSLEKLGWLSGEHLKKLAPEEFLRRISDYYPEEATKEGAERWPKLTLLFKTRLQTLKDFRTRAGYFFEEPVRDSEVVKKYFGETPNLPKYLESWLQGGSSLPAWTAGPLESLTRETAAREGVGAEVLIHPLRYALTGSTVSPGLFEVIELLGRDVSIARIKNFLSQGV